MKAIYQLIWILDLTAQKPELAESVSNGRTQRLSELTDHEGNKLLHFLRNEEERLMKPSRGKVLHLLGLLGYTTPDGKLDFDRINAFVSNIGSNNPGKKPLFRLDRTELNLVVTQVEQMYKSGGSKKKKAAQPLPEEAGGAIFDSNIPF